MEANVLILRNAQKRGFKSLPIAINSESEDRQAIGHRSQLAANPSPPLRLSSRFVASSVYDVQLRLHQNSHTWCFFWTSTLGTSPHLLRSSPCSAIRRRAAVDIVHCVRLSGGPGGGVVFVCGGASGALIWCCNDKHEYFNLNWFVIHHGIYCLPCDPWIINAQKRSSSLWPLDFCCISFLVSFQHFTCWFKQTAVTRADKRRQLWGLGWK